MNEKTLYVMEGATLRPRDGARMLRKGGNAFVTYKSDLIVKKDGWRTLTRDTKNDMFGGSII